MYGNHYKKIGQHFPSIFYILHLTCFNFNQQISSTLQTNIRSIFSSSPMGMGPSSLELPNQLILQTGHRNAEAKTAPWTPNATQRLQVDLLLRLANSTSLVPTWHGAQPRGPESLKWSTSSVPLFNSQNSSQKCEKTKILAKQPEGNLTPLQFQFLSAISENVYGRTCKNVYGRTCKTCTVEDLKTCMVEHVKTCTVEPVKKLNDRTCKNCMVEHVWHGW